MSSYFDEMGRRIQQAVQEHDSAKELSLTETAKERVGNYLVWIGANALKSELQKLVALKAKYEAVIRTPYGAEYLVAGALHNLGHDIGRASIKLRGGRMAGDNPYYPGHYEID